MIDKKQAIELGVIGVIGVVAFIMLRGGGSSASAPAVTNAPAPTDIGTPNMLNYAYPGGSNGGMGAPNSAATPQQLYSLGGSTNNIGGTSITVPQMAAAAYPGSNVNGAGGSCGCCSTPPLSGSAYATPQDAALGLASQLPNYTLGGTLNGIPLLSSYDGHTVGGFINGDPNRPWFTDNPPLEYTS